MAEAFTPCLFLYVAISLFVHGYRELEKLKSLSAILSNLPRVAITQRMQANLEPIVNYIIDCWTNIFKEKYYLVKNKKQ